MTAPDILEILSGAGTLGFAVLAIYAFLTERIVPISRLDEQRKEKAEAMELLRASISSMERLADAVEVRNRLEADREEYNRRPDADRRR